MGRTCEGTAALCPHQPVGSAWHPGVGLGSAGPRGPLVMAREGLQGWPGGWASCGAGLDLPAPSWRPGHCGSEVVLLLHVHLSSWACVWHSLATCPSRLGAALPFLAVWAPQGTAGQDRGSLPGLDRVAGAQ